MLSTPAARADALERNPRRTNNSSTGAPCYTIIEPAQAALREKKMDVPNSETTLVPWYATWNLPKAPIALARVASLRSPNRAHLSGGQTQTRGCRWVTIAYTQPCGVTGSHEGPTSENKPAITTSTVRCTKQRCTQAGLRWPWECGLGERHTRSQRKQRRNARSTAPLRRCHSTIHKQQTNTFEEIAIVLCLTTRQ